MLPLPDTLRDDGPDGMLRVGGSAKRGPNGPERRPCPRPRGVQSRELAASRPAHPPAVPDPGALPLALPRRAAAQARPRPRSRPDRAHAPALAVTGASRLRRFQGRPPSLSARRACAKAPSAPHRLPPWTARRRGLPARTRSARPPRGRGLGRPTDRRRWPARARDATARRGARGQPPFPCAARRPGGHARLPLTAPPPRAQRPRAGPKKTGKEGRHGRREGHRTAGRK